MKIHVVPSRIRHSDDVDVDDDDFLMNEYEGQNLNPPYTVMAFEHSLSSALLRIIDFIKVVYQQM